MNFNYKKNAKYIILPFAICLSIWLFSLALLFFYRPIYIPAEYWLEEGLILKKYLLENINKNKNTIFIVGGSNTTFGISSKILEKEFGNHYNIVNMGMNRSFPVTVSFNYIKQHMKKDDIVILPAEYNRLSMKDLNYWIYRNFSTWGTQYQYLLPIELKEKILLENIKTYWSRIPNIMKPFPIVSKEEIVKNANYKIFTRSTSSHGDYRDINQFGEFFHDEISKMTNSNGYDIYKRYGFPNKINTFFSYELTNFNNYAKENNISFYMTYPVSIKSQLFDVNDKNIKVLLENYAKMLKNISIDFFGTPEFYNMDTKYFYNTHYHPNATGSVLRTMLLAEDIKTYVLGQEPSYEAGQEQAFFEQKEKEALEYMEMLREQERQKQVEETITSNE